MSVDDNKKHHFNPVPRSKWEDTWKKIIDDALIIKIWIKENEKETKEFSIKSYNPELNKIIINQKSNLISIFDNTKDLNNKSILLKVNWGNMQFFASGIFSFTSIKDEFSISLRSDFFQCQQRSFLRLGGNLGASIKMKYQDNIYELFDISGGGLSLVISNNLLNLFNKGDVIDDLKIKIADEQFNIPKAQIVSVGDYDKLQTKVAMKFLDFPEDQQRDLLKKINIEARGAIVLAQLKEHKKKVS
jgi:c-di-GMP-binding flagellar brake protein YcgR